jgi:hypothetical protein
MTQLVLAITDFALPTDAGSAPQLSGLDRLLARGHLQSLALPCWRHWILQEAGLDPPERLPVAGTLAGKSGHWAVATPVHLLAGLEHVHLDPAGLPAVTELEWQELASGFNGLFADSGMSLSFDGEVALLNLGAPLEARTHDPRQLAGRDAGAWLPSGPDGGRLRRLMTEIQMWLHEHPLNLARNRRGAPPVNGLWIWGCGGEPLLPVSSLPGLSTSDPFLRRWWEASGAACAPTPPALETWLSEPHAIVTLDLAAIDPDPAASLQRVEERWFAPLVRALSDGSVSGARLLLGDMVAAFGRYDRLRFWRPRRDWHEALR